MKDDAIERWRREAQLAPLSGGTASPPVRPGKVWPAASGVLGFAITLLIIVAQDGRPEVFSPLYLAVCVLAPAAAVAFRRPGVEVAQSAFAAAAAVFLTLVVVIPVWAIGEALECWASWLAEC